jgi:peptidoglycan biosynthesis protein MviN/MurJ (putative lipid II flippase)
VLDVVRLLSLYYRLKVKMVKQHFDDWKVMPRLMMLVVTLLTYQVTHWYMGLPDPTIQQSGLVSVVMGALTGCFAIWMGKE